MEGLGKQIFKFLPHLYISARQLEMFNTIKQLRKVKQFWPCIHPWSWTLSKLKYAPLTRPRMRPKLSNPKSWHLQTGQVEILHLMSCHLQYWEQLEIWVCLANPLGWKMNSYGWTGGVPINLTGRNTSFDRKNLLLSAALRGWWSRLEVQESIAIWFALVNYRLLVVQREKEGPNLITGESTSASHKRLNMLWQVTPSLAVLTLRSAGEIQHMF